VGLVGGKGRKGTKPYRCLLARLTESGLHLGDRSSNVLLKRQNRNRSFVRSSAVPGTRDRSFRGSPASPGTRAQSTRERSCV
jgi:hypothetical protein